MKLTSTHPLAGVAAGIMDELRELYDAIEARRWMLSGQELLGGRSPLQLIKEGRAEEVRRLIAQIKDGVYL